ncbi:hypothetical protein, partial [Nocardia gipuzkoensis]
IYRFTGIPNTGWEQLDANPATKAIAAAGNHLYQLHDSGRIYRFTGIPNTGWEQLDANPATKAIAAFDGTLVQLHNTGRAWSFNGTPNTGWNQLDNNPAISTLTVGVEQPISGNIASHHATGIYELHTNGTIRELVNVITGCVRQSGVAAIWQRPCERVVAG